MAPKSLKSIFDVPSDDAKGTTKGVRDILLRDILSMDSINVLKYLTRIGLLKSGGECCSECGPDVEPSLVKAADRSDGYKWRCPKCKDREHSLRDGSIFSGSKLDIVKAFAILYMWAWDFDNHHAARELEVDAGAVVDWYAKFRNVCLKYNHAMMGKIGGPRTIVEFDQTCLVHQKQHRGKEKPGTQVWYCVGVERDAWGLCFVQRVRKRDVRTLDWVLETYVADGTTLITDEWSATLNSHLRLAEHHFNHYLIKHKEAFARWVNIEDPELASGRAPREITGSASTLTNAKD